MRKILAIAVFILFIPSILFAQYSNKDISENAFKLIRAAVFEVVVDKAEDNRLTYEKPLDMESMPFKERIDKYESIGTAFAISKNEIITAFHVINLSSNSMVYKKYYIRDSKGNVDEIDYITAASNERDIITCTVKNKTFPVYMRAQTNWEIGKSAFTVGNALGEGIVVRQGLILGTDPEPISGRWDLLKTSADSSPGNSGGPLITADGSVIGVVVSRKDNIQYTVPIKVLQNMARNNLEYRHKTNVRHAILANKTPITYTANIGLPAPYQQVRATLCDQLQKQYVVSMEQLFKEAPEYLSGPQNLYLLNFSPATAFPEVDFVDGDDENWSLSSLQSRGTKFPDDGQMTSSKLSDFSVTRIKKPRSDNLTKINTDPKYIVDSILKNNKSVRRFFGNDYRILSYGEPLNVSKYKDIQGKTWIAAEWLIDYCDNIYIAYILPLPSGPVIVSTVQHSSVRDMYQWDIKKICDHLHASYTSDFNNWNIFLNNREFVPDFLKGFHFNWQRSVGEIAIKYDEVSISMGKEIFNWSDNSELFLTLCYYKTDSGINYGIDYMTFQFDGIKNDYFSFRKNYRPNPDLGRKAMDRWNTLIKKSYPYDNKSYISTDDNTGSIGAVLDTENVRDDTLYSVFLRMEDPRGDAEILSSFGALKQDINIR
ncbi:MAG: serine protease [Termitinemataceae bacterium]|nr:MAG: serine protease [Termitinemataceae bacterium]